MHFHLHQAAIVRQNLAAHAIAQVFNLAFFAIHKHGSDTSYL
jgi:hypothetical protein